MSANTTNCLTITLGLVYNFYKSRMTCLLARKEVGKRKCAGGDRPQKERKKNGKTESDRNVDTQ